MSVWALSRDILHPCSGQHWQPCMCLCANIRLLYDKQMHRREKSWKKSEGCCLRQVGEALIRTFVEVGRRDSWSSWGGVGFVIDKN